MARQRGKHTDRDLAANKRAGDSKDRIRRSCDIPCHQCRGGQATVPPPRNSPVPHSGTAAICGGGSIVVGPPVGLHRIIARDERGRHLPACMVKGGGTRGFGRRLARAGRGPASPPPPWDCQAAQNHQGLRACRSRAGALPSGGRFEHAAPAEQVAIVRRDELGLCGRLAARGLQRPRTIGRHLPVAEPHRLVVPLKLAAFVRAGHGTASQRAGVSALAFVRAEAGGRLGVPPCSGNLGSQVLGFLSRGGARRTRPGAPSRRRFASDETPCWRLSEPTAPRAYRSVCVTA